MNAKTKEAINTHGQNILAIFPNATEQDPVALCKKLRRIETAANRNATDYCNGVIDCEEWSKVASESKRKLVRLLGFPKGLNYCPVGINGDARGYSLKIASEFAKDLRIERDWGGYGILAPDLTF